MRSLLTKSALWLFAALALWQGCALFGYELLESEPSSVEAAPELDAGEALAPAVPDASSSVPDEDDAGRAQPELEDAGEAGVMPAPVEPRDAEVITDDGGTEVGPAPDGGEGAEPPRYSSLCDPGDDCLISCVGSCSIGCEAAHSCRISSGLASESRASCVGAAHCAVGCGPLATCSVDCRDAADCSLRCQAGSSCQLDCGSGSCALPCHGGRTCDLRCDSAVVTCPDGTLVCNRACP